MNYRHDSDIVESYGFRIRNRNVPLSKKDYTLRKLPNGLNVNWNMKKGNPIFWVASHCPTDNFREDYVQELKKHIGINLYMHDFFEKKSQISILGFSDLKHVEKCTDLGSLIGKY